MQSANIGEGTRIWQFCVVLPDAQIGKDCNICWNVFIENNVVIGDGVTVKCGVHLWDGLRVDGEFFVGPNTTIIVDQDAFPVVGRKKHSSGSGFTGSARVMVNKNVRIGTDCIIAWNVFITDCDWHELHGSPTTSPTLIGEAVWIAHGVSILKGTSIGNGCVVSVHSVCAKQSYPEQSLLAGAPARVVRSGVFWRREMSIK